MAGLALALAVAVCTGLVIPTHGTELAAAEPAAAVTTEQSPPAADTTEQSPPAASSEEGGGSADETQQLLNRLTISMVTEVIDERTVLINDMARSGRRHLRLGNVMSPEQASLSDDEHAAKLEASKNALAKLLSHQTVWWKAAADEHQPTQPEAGLPLVLADLWLIDGRHVNSLLRNEGHLSPAEHYHEELARNILKAEADEKKQEQYKVLEEALRENEKAKAEMKAAAAAEAKKEEEQQGEPMGFAGWVGLALLVVLVVGAVANFGRVKKQKINLNRKRGPFERLLLTFKSRGHAA